MFPRRSSLFASLVISASVFVVGGAATGCSVKTAPAASSAPAKPGAGTDGGSSSQKAKPKTAPKTTQLKKLGGNTPPPGATSKGVQTKPQVGKVTVPIENVEVYSVAADFDGDGTEEEVFWAYDESGVNYLWLIAPVTCADGATDAAGGFLMVLNADGSGSYLFTLEGCESSDLFGCDFDADGNETTCGACSLDGEQLVCATSG